MKALKMMFVTAVVSLLAAAPGFAQGAATQKPPATPPATQTPAAPPAAAPAPPPRPPAAFPEGAKFAFVDIQAVASNSAEGKSATAKLDAFRKKKSDELAEKQKALAAAQSKLQTGGTVLSDAARVQLEKDIEKMNRDMQFAQQDAQTELQETTQQLQNEFQDKLNPVIEAVRVEKGLLMIFSIRDSGIVSAEPGLDLSGELVKRFDATAKPAAPVKK